MLGASGSYGRGKGHEESFQSYTPSDPAAAQRLADIADRQVTMGEEAWELYQTDFLPYEQESMKSNLRLMDANVSLMEKEFGLTKEMIGLRLIMWMVETVKIISLDMKTKRASRGQLEDLIGKMRLWE